MLFALGSRHVSMVLICLLLILELIYLLNLEAGRLLLL